MDKHYLKRAWNETRGDLYDHWGTSIWYFETDAKGNVLRQVEEYTVGLRLRYDTKNKMDNYGLLSDARLYLSDPKFIKINYNDFEDKWTQGNPAICKTIDDASLSIKELETIEVFLPLSDTFYAALWNSNSIEKLKNIPAKHSAIEDFNETMFLNKNLTSVLEILETNKVNFSENTITELDSVINFIKDAQMNGNDIQFWL